MEITASRQVRSLVEGVVCWLSGSPSPADVIRATIPVGITGLYCLWWKERSTFPSECTFLLKAGKRGALSALLKREQLLATNHVPLYVGKGLVAARIRSHLKPAQGAKDSSEGRNPYWWMRQMFAAEDAAEMFRRNVGFTFIEKSNKLELVFAENLAVGLLRPWFNFRFAS